MSEILETLAPDWRAHLAAALKQAESLDSLVSSTLPPDVEHHFNRGNTLLRQGSLLEAASSYRDALARSAELPGAQVNLGVALARQGLLEEAAQCYWHALRLNPGYVMAHYNLRLLGLAKEARYRDNLVLLHDVLARTDFQQKYYVIGGVLLGWAREGRIIPHDYYDADFGYHADDRPCMLGVFDTLHQAGFRLTWTWVNNAGAEVEYTFMKDDAKFEFFEMARHDAERLRYFYFYGGGHGPWVELTSAVPMDGVEDMEFLGRTWLKPKNHARYLTACYGSWHVVNKRHSYRDDKSIISVQPCPSNPWHWGYRLAS